MAPVKRVLFIAFSLMCSMPALAADMSDLVGTVKVEFMPMQAGGVLEGCTLV